MTDYNLYARYDGFHRYARLRVEEDRILAVEDNGMWDIGVPVDRRGIITFFVPRTPADGPSPVDDGLFLVETWTVDWTRFGVPYLTEDESQMFREIQTGVSWMAWKRNNENGL